MALPAAVVVGCWTNVRFVAGPTVMVSICVIVDANAPDPVAVMVDDPAFVSL